MVEIKRKVSLKQKTEGAESSSSTSPKPEVNLRRKVSLKEKTGGLQEQEVVTSSLNTGGESSSSNENRPVISKGKKFILGVVVLLLLAGGVYALLNQEKGNQTDQESLTTTTITINSDSKQNPQEDNSQPDAVEQTDVVEQQGEMGETDIPSDIDETSVSSIEEETKVSDSSEETQADEPSATRPDLSESVSVENINDNNTQTVNSGVENSAPKASQTQTKQSFATYNTTALWDDLDQQAKEVILGRYGNGAARKDALGDEYDEIQAKVNEYYRLKYGN